MAARKISLGIPLALEHIDATLNSSLELKEIFLKTCQTAVDVFGVDHSGLVLFDEDNVKGIVEAEFPDWDLRGKTVPLRGVPDEEKLIKTKKPLMIVDVADQTALGSASYLLVQHGIKSVLVIPVTIKQRVIGSFSLDVCTDHRKFTTQEIKLCNLLAERVSGAIENAKLFSSLVKTRGQLDGLVSSSLDAVIFIDAQKHITIFNKKAEEMFGYTAFEIQGQPIVKLYSDIRDARSIWKVIHDEGEIAHREITLVHKNGTKIPILLSAISIKDDNGNEVGQAGFLHTRLIDERLYALAQAIQSASGSIKLNDVLQNIMVSALTAFPVAEKGVIHLYEEETGKLVVMASIGYSPEVIQAASFEIGEGRAGWVYKHGTPLVIANTQKDRRFSKINVSIDHPEVTRQKSTICVPLRVKSKVIGTVSLDNLTIFNAFTPNDIDLLSVFADQVSIAIENAQLFEQSQRDLNIASNFYEISNKLYPTHSPNEALKIIAASVKDAMGALSVSITALDTAGRPYEKAHDGYDEQKRVVRHNGLSTIVLATGVPCVVPDVSKATIKINPGMIKSGVKAAICLPLQSQGRNVGVMWVTYARPHLFSETETKLLGLLANHAGAFVISAHLFQERQLLLETSRMILSSRNLDECLQTLAELMIQSLSATTFCLITILDDSDKTLRIRAAYSVKKDLQWKPEIGKQYLIASSPEEALTVKTGQTQIFQKEKNPGQLLSLAKMTRFQGNLKSAVLIPLSVGEKVFGVITLGERRDWERGSYTLERVGLYQAMASQVAGFIARMRLQEQSEKDFAQLNRLYEASSKIGSALDPDQTLHFIVEKACEAVDGWRATAVLLDRSKKPHRLATTGFDKELEVSSSIRPDGISMAVMRTGDSVIVEDAATQKDKLNPFMIRDGVKAAICLPLCLGEDVIGALWIHYKQPHQFSPFQIESLKIYATQAAIAYDNVRKMNELEHMHQAAKSIAGVLELPGVLQQIVKSACEVLEADSSAIWSYDDVSNQFFPAELASHGITKEQLERFRKKEPKIGGTADTVMAMGWLGVTDISKPQYDFMGSSTLKLLKSIGAKSFQGIALKVGEERLGVLYLNYSISRNFTGEDRETLETFAYYAATALKKARLLEQLRGAQDAAKLVANATVLDDKSATLFSVASETKDATGSDAVVLFEYDQGANKLIHPPVMVGVNHPNQAMRYGEVIKGSLVFEMLQLDKPYIVEKINEDHLFKGKRFAKDEGIESCLAIPLRVRERKVGVMFVNYRLLHRFTAYELTNIGLFANQAAVAISNSQLHTEIQKRVETLRALYDSGRAITSSLSVEDILDRIAEEALLILGPGYQQKGCFSHIALLNEGKLPFVAAFPKEMLPQLQNKFEIDFNRDTKLGIAGRAVRTGELQNVKDVTKDKDYIKTSELTKSQLSVPINKSGHVIGVLSLEHPEYNAFVDEDAHTLGLLANQAEVAIENARLFKAAEQRADNLDAILQVSQTTISSLDLELILTAACRAVVDLLKVDHSGLVLFSENLMTGKVYAEYPRIGTAGLSFPVQGVPIEEQLITYQEPIVISDVNGERGLDPVRALLTELETCSLLIVPIVSKGRILGSLGLDVMKQPRIFTREEINLCKVFAAQVAVAIDNARQYDELKKTKGLVGSRTALAWMGMANSIWRHKIEGYAINIRNTTILMRQDIQKHDLTEEQRMQFGRRLEVIDGQAIRILDKPLTPPLSNEEGVEPILIGDLVRERITQIWEDEIFRSIKLQLELDANNVEVMVSPDWFRRVLDILIDNSVDAMSDSLIRILSVSSRVVEDKIEIFISDTGKGIAPQLQEKLFRDPIEKPEGAKGFGMGLLMVQAIMQTYKGDARLDRSGSNGTTFVISLPIAH